MRLRNILMIAMMLVAGIAIPVFGEQPNKAESSSFWQVLNDIFPSRKTDSSEDKESKVLLEQQTGYFNIVIEEDSVGCRRLLFKPNLGLQGIWSPAHPNLLISPYAKYAALLLQQAKKANKALFVGMGVAVVPRYLKRHYPEIMIDLVEIDAAIPDLAKRYFGFEELGYNIIIADGRDYINRNRKLYDMILVDAYGPNGVPFHLSTVEFYRKISNSLSEGGVLVVNLANLSGKEQFVAAALKTISDVFPDLAVFACNQGSNYIVAAKNCEEITDQSLKHKFMRIDGPENPGIKPDELVSTRLSREEISRLRLGAKVLTDDFAPVETMTSK